MQDKIMIAIDKAKDIFSSVGLNGWTVWTNNSYSVIAKVQFDRKRLVYSKRYITIATEEEFLKTTMHEAAHALLPYGVGHGDEFVKLCNELNPDNPYDFYCISAPIHKYILTCPWCGDIGGTNFNKPIFCVPCSMSGRGVYELVRTNNDLEVREWASTQ